MKFIKESGPHIKSSDTTSKIMTRFLIALAPIIVFAIFKNSVVVYFTTDASILESLHPLFMIITAILTSFISELLWFKFVLKNDYKSSLYEIYRSFTIIPGLLLALVLPPNVPLWLVAFGTFFANIIGKMIFGGFGQNIFNPALIGYLFISASYQSLVGSHLNLYEIDTLAGATPLAHLASMDYVGSYDSIVGSYGTLLNFLTGSIPGAMGEISKLLIIISFIYLVLTKTIKWIIPTVYVSTIFVITFIISRYLDLGIWYPLFHILSGGLLFGAVFMATDPVTSPVTIVGQIASGLFLGILTVVLRFLTPYPEGVATSILCMNMLVPVFDKIGLINIKRLWIVLVIFLIIIFVTIFGITRSLDKEAGIIDDLNNKVTIEKVTEKGSSKIYNMTSKGWGVIKAEVEVEDKTIKSIIVTDSSTETQWSEIEKNNYIYQVIQNQDDIDKLDAVAGSTYSSDALKNIIKRVKYEG